MTTLAALRQSGAIHLYADGVAYTSDLARVGLIVKTYPMVHLRAALAATGPAWLAPLLASAASQMPSYDVMKASIPDIVRMLVRGLVAQHRQFGQDLRNSGVDPWIFSILVGGWSDLTGPDTFIINNRTSIEAPDWNVEIEAGGPLIYTAFHESVHAEVAKAFPSEQFPSPDAWHPDRDGRRLLDILVKSDPRAANGHRTITTVRRDEIRIRMLL